MVAVNWHKVTSLPGSLDANAFYFVENGTYTESYLTNSAGVARSIGNSSMITAIVNSLLAPALADFNSLEIVADITARDALSLTRNAMVLVQDASADPEVDSGAALYAFTEAGGTWTLTAEYDEVSVAVTWANLQDKPTSSVATIDDAVTKRHDHGNKTFLDKIGETGGAMTYDGSAISADWATNNW